MKKIDYSLYLVTDRSLSRDRPHVDIVDAAVTGGVSCVQLREKLCSTRDFLDQARALLAVLRPRGIPLIINDRIDIALAVGADGVHLGQDDVSPEEARARLGLDRLIGLSCETEAHVRAADPSVVDYLGLGTVFPTRTKGDHTPAIGLLGLRALCAASPLPTVAIGGLQPEHAREVFAAGSNGLAVVSAICGQPDPERAARAFYQPQETRP